MYFRSYTYPNIVGPVIEHLLGIVTRRLTRKEGQTLVEYSLILAVLTIVMIAVMKLLGARIVVIFSAVTTLLDTAQSSH